MDISIPQRISVKAPPLRAKLAPWMESVLLQDWSGTKQWLENHGSPLHLTVLSEFEKNIDLLKRPMLERGLEGELFFARKANKLPWFVKRAGEKGIGVDTASLTEVKETLALGVPAEKIVVTAIGKTRALVETAIKEGCLLVIDNEDEFNLIAGCAARIRKEARIGLRFAGFQTRERVIQSRFGFPIKDARDLAQKVHKTEWLKLEVFHAHIDKYDPEERAAAAFQMIEVIDDLGEDEIEIKGLDLGGGILINYLEDESQWDEYLKQLKAAVLGESPSFNLNQDGLGFYKEDGELKGEADLYPFYNKIPKEKFVASILDQVDPGDSKAEPLHTKLQDRKLKISFEPGRALLDNTGASLMEVAFRKFDTAGNALVGVAANRMNLRPFRAEFCLDPLLLSRGGRDQLDKGAFIAGCLCSESDYIFKRRLNLPYMPEAGDIFLVPNTAGYLAHHMEIGTHGDPLPKNLLLDEKTLEVMDTN